MKSYLTKDPLHEIIERHLYRGATDDATGVQTVEAIVTDYMAFLLSQGVHIPGPFKPLFISDLQQEVRELLVKKTFGAVNIEPELFESRDRLRKVF